MVGELEVPTTDLTPDLVGTPGVVPDVLEDAEQPEAPQGNLFDQEPHQEGEPVPVQPGEGAPVGGAEPVELAAAGPIQTLIGAASKALKKGGDEVAPPPARTTTQVQEIGNRIIITDADETTARRFREVFNLPEDQRVPIYKPNLGALDVDDVTGGYVDALNILFEQDVLKARRGKMTMSEILDGAKEMGFDSAFLEVMGRRVGDDVGPEQLARSIWVFQHVSMALDDVMRNGTDAEVLQMLPIAGRVTINTAASASEAGRTMAVLSNASKFGAMGDIERLSNLPELLKRYGIKEETVTDMRAAYTALPKSSMRKRMGRGLFQKGLDVWAELYINSLLSSPVTHMVNITSNLIFGMFQLPERALAGALGALRTNILRGFTSSDRVFMSESMAMVQSLRQGLSDAIVASKRGLVSEEETFGAMSKIDVRERRAISSEFLGLEGQSPVGLGVDGLGIVTRFMGSRLLLAEDEFAKGIAFQAELYAQAQRRMKVLINDGMEPDKAAEEGARILAGRDAAAVRTAQEGAQRLTFQGDLGAFASKFSAIMSHPAAKIFVPFYKTPTNILKETMARTPLGLLPGSGFWTDFRAGGASADLAMSRLVMGSSIFMTVAYAAAGGEGSAVILTGAGPEDKTAKAAWRRLKLQKHSIAFRNEDGTYESFDYSRLAPIAGILAMAADYAQYSQYEDDASALEQLYMSGPLALYDQMKELPMMQGLFSIVDILGSEFEGGREKMERSFELIAKQLTAAGLSSLPLVPTGSLTATVERVLNPNASNTMPAGDEIDAGPLARGFYEALNKAKARNPFFSNDVSAKLNLWGETMKSCENGLWCFISPIRVIDSKHQAVDQELVALGLGLTMPRKTQRGIKLNAEQYNELIVEMNLLQHGEFTMIEELGWSINQDFYQNMEAGEKIEYLRSVKAGYQKEAVNTVFGNDSRLQAKDEFRKDELKRTGKAP